MGNSTRVWPIDLYSARQSRVLYLAQSAIFPRGSGLKCFLVNFVWGIHFVDLNHVDFQSSANR